MKTLLIKYKSFELLNICDMSFGEFIILCGCLKNIRHYGDCKMARELAIELHSTAHWLIDWNNKCVSLICLNWADACMLSAMIVDYETYLLQNRQQNYHEKMYLDKMLKALDAAMELGVQNG